jgi:hypothetical protein
LPDHVPPTLACVSITPAGPRARERRCRRVGVRLLAGKIRRHRRYGRSSSPLTRGTRRRRIGISHVPARSATGQAPATEPRSIRSRGITRSRSTRVRLRCDARREHDAAHAALRRRTGGSRAARAAAVGAPRATPV